MAGESKLTVKQIEAKTGLSASTIHYYTALELLRAAGRKGSARLYPARLTMERLKRIRTLLERGHSLAGIKDSLSRDER